MTATSPAPSIDARDTTAPIRIAMEGAHVVIRPHRYLDRDATEALTAAINATVASGSLAVIDLDGGPALGDDTDRAVAAGRAAGEPVPATTTCAGLVRLASSAAWWTLDVGNQRLCRSLVPVDARFIPADAWTLVTRLWVSATTLTALTGAGMFISARRRVD